MRLMGLKTGVLSVRRASQSGAAWEKRVVVGMAYAYAASMACSGACSSGDRWLASVPSVRIPHVSRVKPGTHWMP